MKVAMPPTAKMATRITHIISVSPAWVPSLEQLVLIFSQKMWIVNACWTHQSWTSTLLTDSWLIDWCFVFIIHHFEKVSVFLYPTSHNAYRFHCWRHLSELTLCLNISLYTFLANIEEAERTEESESSSFKTETKEYRSMLGKCLIFKDSLIKRARLMKFKFD